MGLVPLAVPDTLLRPLRPYPQGPAAEAGLNFFGGKTPQQFRYLLLGMNQ